MPLTRDEIREELRSKLFKMPPTQAVQYLKRMIGGQEDVIDEVAAELLRQIGEITNLREPRVIRDHRESWYPGPGSGDRFWPSLERYLLDVKKWHPDNVKSVDQASTRVVSLLDFPGQPRFSTRGLVLGYVQSGKTANFTAVVSKAGDAGYRVFIILSGLTNSLRNQTQERLHTDLVNLQQEQWMTWTTADGDIGDLPFNINAMLGQHSAHKHLAVVKKNSSRLRRLLLLLRDASDPIKSNCPVLVIDDECDQASVNAAKALNDDPTAINALMREILAVFPKVGYIGYTATPYANVLIDPTNDDDLYPRDFIVDLPLPDDYFGPEGLFGRGVLDGESEESVDQVGLDMINTIPEEECELLRPASRTARHDFLPTITPSLRKAIQYFWMATAARRCRGHHSKHSSMLVHTTVYSEPHRAFIGPLEAFRDQLKRDLAVSSDERIAELEGIWSDESDRISAERFGLEPVSFCDLFEYLSEVVEATDFPVENSISDNRLDYSEPGRIYVVIGGNVLARGLTIEGLVVSYFLRTSSAYDSLMQMGRWFGYRPGYADLPRVWMTEEMQRYFHDLATVEEEIRNDIRRYERENITPREFAVRIRTHPQLAVTARNKMHAAISVMQSFSGRCVWTLRFRHLDEPWLQANLTAGQQLLTAACEQGRLVRRDLERWLIKDVPVGLVTRFLENYKVDESSPNMAPASLIEYIGRQNARDPQPLGSWNIAVIGHGHAGENTIRLDGKHPVGLVNRSRYTKSGYPWDVADIKALASKADMAIDFDPAPSGITRMSWEEIQGLRRPNGVESHPLLLLYPINRDSSPLSGSKVREKLNAVRHVLGLAISFPHSDDLTPVGYVTVPVAEPDWEEPESPGAES